MSFEWIKSYKDIENHPKTLTLMSLLRWSKSETIGFLHRFWWWADDVCQDGIITKIFQPGVFSGRFDFKLTLAQTVIDSLRAAGWVDVLEDGETVIHNHDRYRARSKNSQDATRERVRKHRELKRTGNAPVTRYQEDVTLLDEEEDKDKEETHTTRDPPEIPDSLITLAEGVLGPTPVGQLRLLAMDGHPMEWIEMAVKETGFRDIRQGTPAVGYARKILQGWAKNGGPPKDENPRTGRNPYRANDQKAKSREPADFSDVRNGELL